MSVYHILSCLVNVNKFNFFSDSQHQSKNKTYQYNKQQWHSRFYDITTHSYMFFLSIYHMIRENRAGPSLNYSGIHAHKSANIEYLMIAASSRQTTEPPRCRSKPSFRPSKSDPPTGLAHTASVSAQLNVSFS